MSERVEAKAEITSRHKTSGGGYIITDSNNYNSITTIS